MADEYREQLATTAGFYRILQSTDGFKMLLAWYQTELQSFANSLLNEEGKKTEEFNTQRYELIGMKRMLSHITETIDEDDRQREKERGSDPGK